RHRTPRRQHGDFLARAVEYISRMTDGLEAQGATVRWGEEEQMRRPFRAKRDQTQAVCQSGLSLPAREAVIDRLDWQARAGGEIREMFGGRGYAGGQGVRAREQDMVGLEAQDGFRASSETGMEADSGGHRQVGTI